jgi:hypothetical protein
MFRSCGVGAHVNQQITGWHSKLFKAWSMEQPGYWQEWLSKSLLTLGIANVET